METLPSRALTIWENNCLECMEGRASKRPRIQGCGNSYGHCRFPIRLKYLPGMHIMIYYLQEQTYLSGKWLRTTYVLAIRVTVKLSFMLFGHAGQLRMFGGEKRSCFQKCRTGYTSFVLLFEDLMHRFSKKEVELMVITARRIWLRRNSLIF